MPPSRFSRLVSSTASFHLLDFRLAWFKFGQKKGQECRLMIHWSTGITQILHQHPSVTMSHQLSCPDSIFCCHILLVRPHLKQRYLNSPLLCGRVE